MIKLLTVIGARPQFIKASILSGLIDLNESAEEIVVHTGQHYDANMSEIFFDELGIRIPQYNLGISGGSHSDMTARMMIEIDTIMRDENPDLVLLYGDTNSTLAGALVASKLNIPIAHVEAGLRSWNWKMPEEINRVLVDRLSSYHFAPTEIARDNLINEGVALDRIHVVGDIMFDATLKFSKLIATRLDLLHELNVSPKGYILLTLHRQSNTDNAHTLRQIFKAIDKIAEQNIVVFPIHPRTKAMLSKYNVTLSSRIRVIDPVGYLDMLVLERNSSLIVTDSGGVQKEAYFNRVSCVTLREDTEWTELVKHAWNVLVSPNDTDSIVSTVLSRINMSGEDCSLYGEGDTGERILKELL